MLAKHAKQQRSCVPNYTKTLYYTHYALYHAVFGFYKVILSSIASGSDSHSPLVKL